MRKWLAVFLVPCALLIAVIEDSIVGQLDHFEQIGNLEQKKYASGQWEEIVEALSKADERVRVMSYNMLMDAYESQLARKDRWINRRSRVAELVLHDHPDLICSQELQANQIDDLVGLIGDAYHFYGVGELDGKRKGQHNGMFYLPERLELVEGKALWMSETPERVSCSAVDPKPRQLTVCHFRDRQTGKEFVAMNTHLRFNNPNSRAYCARFISRLAATYTIPVVVAGDMNTFPNRPDLWALPFFDGDYISHLLTDGVLDDSATVAVAGNLGSLSTFTTKPDDPCARPFRGTGRPGVILDHIYVTDDITVLMHAVEPARVDGHFPSDHLPVMADLIL
jgi:endonuclease/exonuclease/phosphatase family metal-dependent hydrolase